MPHIHTDSGHHDLTISGFIVRTDLAEPMVLMHVHKKLGVYLQFGGHVELHENPWQALAHELLEESGYVMDQLQVLQPKLRYTAPALEFTVQHPVPFSFNTHAFKQDRQHYHMDTTFAFVTAEKPRHRLAAGEANTLKLMTAADLRALSDSAIYPDIRGAGLFVLEQLVREWEPVPTPAVSA